MKKRKNLPTSAGDSRKGISRNAVITLVALAVSTVVALAVYKLFMAGPYFMTVFFAYIAIATASIISYVIYNRGFSRKGVTVDMLPAEWSDEEKQKFVDDAKERASKSRWLLIVIFALVFTFAFDAFEIFVLDGLLG